MKRLMAVVSVVLAAVLLCSCSAVGLLLQGASAVMKARAGVQENSTDYWKGDIPSSIPEFKYGTYQSSFSFKRTDKEGASYMMEYKGVTKQDLDDYADELKAAGFDVSTMDDSNGYMVTGMPAYRPAVSTDDETSQEGLPIPTVSDTLTGNWVDVNLMPSGDCMVNVSIYASAEPSK